MKTPTLRSLCFLVIMAFAFVPIYGNATTLTTERTQTTLLTEQKTIHAGERFWAVLHIQLMPGWHTYWINPGDSGIPPQLKWTLPNGFTAGDTQYLAPDREHIGPLVDYAYDHDAYYLVNITPPPILKSGMTAILSLKASWLVCKDVCIPESGELSLALPVGDKSEPGDDAQLIGQLVNRLPATVPGDVPFSGMGGNIRFGVPMIKASSERGAPKSMQFFPVAEGFIDNTVDVQTNSAADGSYVLTVKQVTGSKVPDAFDGVLSVFYPNDKREDYALHLMSKPEAVPAIAGAVMVPGEPGQVEHVSLIEAIAYALLGGLILNCMPCVFPVLSLKALAVAKKAAAHPRQVRKQGIAYTSGVIVTFLMLAFALLALQKGGESVGWGYQLQSPGFVALLALLLFVIGLSLAGYFELPVLLGNVGAETASQDNALGSFLTGVLAVVVATPCTAPFMASAIGFALTQGTGVILATFAALGIGLASPFLLISFFPRLIKALPRPGAWMNTFKEFLAFPMFGWSVWLLWVLAREAGAQAACIVLFGMVLVSFALWLWRRPSNVLSVLSILTGIAGISSAYVGTQYFMPQGIAVVDSKENRFSPAKLDELRKEGKAVFVDATADWCLICKVNEAVALSSQNVMQAFKEKNVSYLVADWTHYDPEILSYLQSFGRSGVPIYVYYPAGGGPPQVLPQVLTPSTVLKVLE